MSIVRVITIVLLASGCANGAPPPQPPQAQPQTTSVTPTAAPTQALPEAPVDTTPKARALVKLIVLGEFPEELTSSVVAGLSRELQVDVESIEGVPLPSEAYYPRRRRYRADRLLDFLNEHLEGEPDSTRVLGLTSVDISTTKPPHEDWGVFGLGEIGGRACVISTFRLGRRVRNQEHLDFRVTTTAIHEVGHTLGLEHCTEPTCIMRDAEGSIRTVDTSSGVIEPECRAELDQESPRVVDYVHLDPQPSE